MWDDDVVVGSFNYLSYSGYGSSGGRHLMRSELSVRLTGAALADRRLAEIPTDEWNDVRVDVTPREYVLEYLAHGHPDAEFFLELAFKALLERLTSFALAPWKLPIPAQMGILATPGDEHPVVSKHESGCNLHDSNVGVGRNLLRSADLLSLRPGASF